MNGLNYEGRGIYYESPKTKSDLIIVKDKLVVSRENISHAIWNQETKVLKIQLKVCANQVTYVLLEDEEAFRFWEMFTGEMVSFDPALAEYLKQREKNREDLIRSLNGG